jgi:hypothetical protein
MLTYESTVLFPYLNRVKALALIHEMSFRNQSVTFFLIVLNNFEILPGMYYLILIFNFKVKNLEFPMKT